MRLAAIYDIHANLPALEAVLDEIRGTSVVRIVVGGDVVPGPMPLETLQLLSSVAIPIDFIQGNGEVAVIAEMEGKNPAVPESVRPVIQWTAQQLNSEQRHLLASWPKTIRIEIAGLGKTLFCHATPENENDIVTRETLEQRLSPIFSKLDVAVVVCGHTHMQFDRMIGGVRVVNAGSVGMPFGKPGAHWLLLGPDLEPRYTLYDLPKAAARVRDTNYPQADQFSESNILNPPTEEQMLRAFKSGELK